jgi:hypothetical protein
MKKLLPVWTAFVLSVYGPAVCAAPPTVDPTYNASAPRASSVAQPAPAGARWIWTAVTRDTQTIYARAKLTLSRAPKSAALYATADNLFEVFINGRRIGGTLDTTDPEEWKRVQRYDVRADLKAGVNVVAIRAINQGGAAGLLARLEVDGKPVLETDGRWRVTERSDIPGGWIQAQFDDSRWEPGTVIAQYGGGPWGENLTDWPESAATRSYLAHLMIRPRSVRTLSGAAGLPLRIAPAAAEPSSTVIVDFGQELAGRVQIWGTEGAPVTITTGESRRECDIPEPPIDNNGPFKRILQDKTPVSTSYTAFRYAKLVFTGSEPVELTRVVCDHKYYPARYRGAFDCSDPLLTRIWYTGAYTAHLCMQEDIWDAPKRDRGLWIGDLQVTGQTINNVFADRFLMERTIEGGRDGAQGGRPAKEMPTSDVNTIPGYSAAWFCDLADFYRHSGDLGFLKRQQEKIVPLLEYQRAEFDERDLFVNPHKAWDFCDWATGFVVDGPQARAATDLYIIWGVREAVFLLRELGDVSDALKYAAWADRLAAAARRELADRQTQTFGMRLQENAMAILADVATPEQRAAIYSLVLRPGSPAWAVHPAPNLDDGEAMSPYYGYFVLEALGKLGRHQDAIGLMRRYWGDMLRRGAVTWWEKFDPSWPDFSSILTRMPILSLSHGWSSGPTTYLTEYVLGVRPTGAGFRTVEIQPHLGDLKWAEGDVPAPAGNIHVRAERRGGRLSVTVTLPKSVSATIRVSGKSLHAARPGTYRIGVSAVSEPGRG